MAIGLASACNLHNEGVTAPEGAIAYPQALALSREVDPAEAVNGPDYLYVANTNYDLRYNGGSVQSFDLDALDVWLTENRCRKVGVRAATGKGPSSVEDHTTYALPGSIDASTPDAGALDDGGVVPVGGMDAGRTLELPADLTFEFGTPRGVLCDGRDPVGDGRMPDGVLPEGAPLANPDCCIESSQLVGTSTSAAGVARKPILRDFRTIDSYASAIAVAPDNSRLYVPVESRSRLLYFDLSDGLLDCGGPKSERCRRGPGLKSPDDVPDEDFPRQIANMAVGRLSELGIAPDAAGDPVYIATAHELGGFGLFIDRNGAPILEDVLLGLRERPTSLTADPRHELLYVTANRQPYFARIGVRLSQKPALGGKEAAPRELLFASSRVTVTGVSQPSDLRSIVLVDEDRDHDGVKESQLLYILVRGAQESVAILELGAPYGSANARLVDAVRVGAGSSKLVRIEQDGKTFVAASCYDAKAIFVIDTESHKVVSVVRNLSGPFQMVHDPVRKLVYVSDFRISVLRVIDVAGLTDQTMPPPRIVATLGDPEFEGAVTR